MSVWPLKGPNDKLQKLLKSAVWKDTLTPPLKTGLTVKAPSALVKVWVMPPPTKSPGWLFKVKKVEVDARALVAKDSVATRTAAIARCEFSSFDFPHNLAIEW